MHQNHMYTPSSIDHKYERYIITLDLISFTLKLVYYSNINTLPNIERLKTFP